MSAEAYHCRCGARILPEEVAQRNCVALRGIPFFVHVQYRCAACGEAGEKLWPFGNRTEVGATLPPDPWCSWPWAGPVELEASEDTLGPIPAEEVTQFAGAVGRVGPADLAYLRRSLMQQR
jgi:DNA-directed RNA polymerase subunit RPC12/RpoP